MSDLKSQEIGYGERIGSGGNDSILAGLFRRILFDLAIDVGRFEELLDRHIVRHGLAKTTAAISTTRSALRKEFLSNTMTWKVFVKGLVFLRIKDCQVLLELYKETDDDERVHSKSFHELNFIPSEVKQDSDDETDNNSNTNLLADFFRDILSDLNVDPDIFQQLLDQYVKIYKPQSTPTEQYTTKCSLKREILKDKISWKVFVKGLIFLKTYRMVFTVLLGHHSGIKTKHAISIVFR